MYFAYIDTIGLRHSFIQAKNESVKMWSILLGVDENLCDIMIFGENSLRLRIHMRI